MAPTTGAGKVVRASLSANNVFAIPELLESILLNLDKIEIFVLQRVSKTFLSTIAGSPKLQRRLFSTVAWQPVGKPRRLQALSALKNHLQKILPHHATLTLNHADSVSKKFRCSIKLDNDSWDTLGWQGKNAVHFQGSWRKMSAGAAQMGVTKLYSWFRAPQWRWERFNIELESTMGDLVDSFKKLERKAKRDL